MEISTITPRTQAADFILNSSPYSATEHSEKGIVICAGGPVYFTQAWVLIRILRDLGCKLPIELWYRGPDELNDELRHLVSPYQVKCIDAFDLCQQQNIDTLICWTIKPFAILNSSFAEVLYLDVDNVPTRNPEYLFDDSEYIRTGSLFWTDRYRGGNSPLRTIRPGAWEAFNIPERDEPEFESGQILIDKSRVYRELQLTYFFNQHADYYYQFLYGDKDTFRFAWQKMGREYSTIPFGPSSPPFHGVLYQLDRNGQIIFQHRARSKWSLHGENRHVPGFQHTEKCLAYLAELASLWDGTISHHPYRLSGSPLHFSDTNLSEQLSFYCLIDQKEKGHVVLTADGRVSSEVRWMPTAWSIDRQPDGRSLLSLRDENVAPVFLDPQQNGSWIGRRFAGGASRVELHPAHQQSTETQRLNGQSSLLSVKSKDKTGINGSSQHFDQVAETSYPDNRVRSFVQFADSPYPLDQAEGEKQAAFSSQVAKINGFSVPENHTDPAIRLNKSNRYTLKAIMSRSPDDTPNHEIKSEIKIYGLPRTCTNLLARLIRMNFSAHVCKSAELGWKHGPNLLREGDVINNKQIQYVLCARHPYAWLFSCFRFDKSANKNRIAFSDFVRGGCKVYGGLNPIDCFNFLMRIWLGISSRSDVLQVVRSEDLQSNQLSTLEQLENSLHLSRRDCKLKNETLRIGPDEAVRDKPFDMNWYEARLYMKHYDIRLFEYVNRHVDQEILSKIGYQLIDDYHDRFEQCFLTTEYLEQHVTRIALQHEKQVEIIK